jgi:hypothetical protein
MYFTIPGLVLLMFLMSIIILKQYLDTGIDLDIVSFCNDIKDNRIFNKRGALETL